MKDDEANLEIRQPQKNTATTSIGTSINKNTRHWASMPTREKRKGKGKRASIIQKAYYLHYFHTFQAINTFPLN